MVLTALVAVALTPPAVTVTPETYRGWSAYRLSNGQVDLVVVPKVGRVLFFGDTSTKKNLLWENPDLTGTTKLEGGYANYGGDRIWLAPQNLWGWPPDPSFDGAAYEATQIENGIRLTSQTGTKIRVRFSREITLDPQTPTARFRNRLDNQGPKGNYALWQITQVNNPNAVVLPYEVSSGLPHGWHGYGDETLEPEFQSFSSGKLSLKRDPKRTRKFGSFSKSGEVNAYFGSTLFSTKARVLAGQSYPSDSPLQAQMMADPTAYAELGHTSPIQPMQNGEVAYLDVEWKVSTAR